MKHRTLLHSLCAKMFITIATALIFVFTARANYTNVVLGLNPVGFWPLNETSGTTAFDISGNNNNGAYQSGVMLGVAGVPNPPFLGFTGGSGAAGFSGSLGDSSCVTLSNLPINSANVTITEWIYPTNASAVGTTFWNNGQNAGLSEAYFNNAAVGYNWHGGSGGQWGFTGPVPPLNQWSFVAMVVSQTNAVFYLGGTNGVLSSIVNSDNQTSVNFTNGTAIGGPDNGGTSGMNGSMSDVAVFSYSLTPAQITQLYVGGYGGLSIPATPTGLDAAAGNGQVSLSWNASAGAAGYNIKRSTTSGGEATVASVSGTLYTGSGLANGTTYYYEVSATNSAGESLNSAEVSATPSATITSYSAGVMALSPVGFWQLNETSGTTAHDSSGNGNDGTYQAGVSLGVAGVPNPPFTGFPAGGHAARFSSAASSSWVALTNLPITTNTVTFTMWIYPTNTLGALMWDNGASPSGSGLGTYYGDGSELGYNWGGNNWWYQSGLRPPLNQWSFVAMVVTPTNAAFYMDNSTGQYSAIDNDPNVVVDFSNSATLIGSVGPANPGATFNGSMADVAVFGQSLNGAQIAQLFSDSGGNSLPPVITVQPVSHNAYTNGTAIFNVAAGGATPLNYQWYHGASLLSGKTNASLSIANVQPSDAGSYSVTIVNGYGAVSSSTVTLTLAAPPVAYENIIRADNPIGYWPLDLGSDTNQNGGGQYLAADLSGNNNYGAYYNVLLNGERVGPSTYIPNGVGFDGSSTFVDLSVGANTSLLNVSGPMTMEAWVQPAAAQSQANADIFASGWDWSGDETEMSVVNSANFVSSSMVSWTTAGIASSTVTTNWTYLVAGWDGSKWNLYVNGVLKGSASDSTSPAITSPWAIGTGTANAGGRIFTGNICQMALYNNALTPAQVVAHYAMGLYGTTNLAPSIAVEPANQRVPTNTMATFTVVAIGSPLPTYQWYSVIGGVTNAITGATSPSYTTAPVQDSDSGDGYYVVVSNLVGSVTSQMALLTAGHMVTASGFLQADEYFGNYNNDLAAFSVLYPTASSLPTPNQVEYLTTFNDNADLPNGGGERIHGWFTPPVTGNYIFFEASDDASALWLSPNSNPANVYEIAQNEGYMISGSDGAPDWTLSDTNTSEYVYVSTGEWRSDAFETNSGPNAYAYLTGTWSAWPGLNGDGSIPLVAGTPYYIELDHWQNTGGQGAAVTYKLAGNPDPTQGTATLLTGNAISATVPDSVLPEPQPLITNISVSGSKVTAVGNNGLVNALYNVLSSTNLAAPRTNWTVIATQRFNSSGNFSFTNNVTAGSPRQFYLIQVPAN